MLDRAVRGVKVGLGFGGCLALLIGCASAPLDRGAAYVNDRAHRREVLEQSLVDHDNGYAALRLSEYATEAGGWEALPVWNPPVRAVTLDDVGRFASDPAGGSEAAMAPTFEAVEWTEEALLELGERAFETFPVQTTHTLTSALDDADTVERYGLEVDSRDRIAGLVRVRLPGGGESTAFTCATCHARPGLDGSLIHGATNRTLDYGGLLHRQGMLRGQSPESLEEFARWGPGRVDVTADGESNPTSMSDLRATQHQPYIHWAGTIENSLVALAIRLETLMITSMQRSVRPPREVAFALALYLWRMGDVGRPAPPSGPGAEEFESHCASCHGRDGSTPRARIAIDAIGTDPVVGRSPERGTGFYRVPSLWAVGDRAPLLHDASAPSLERLLQRTEAEGHSFGRDLDSEARARLVAYVRSIGAR